jgi:predicted SAM-dependent methyltransferase
MIARLRSLAAETARPVRRELRSVLRGRGQLPTGDRLHFGCGANLMSGWVNVDMGVDGAFDWDLSQPLPAPDHSFRFIYSEHFIEHITLAQALAHLKDCCRLLSASGILRMSTPNLRHLAEAYLSGNISAWSEQGWSPATPAQFLNESLRLWGHQFVYDREELHSLLHRAGFVSVKDCRWRKSALPELCDLETRPYHDDLIVEATTHGLRPTQSS